ncbi:MAG TPA: methylated-DNA--[protein]-cysteine S-methyltransferase [Sandaracinaceae bacterium]
MLDAGRIGPLWLAWTAEGLTMLRFGAEPPPEGELRRWMPGPAPVPDAPIPPLVRDVLTRYFAGEPVDPASLPVRLGGTRFQRRVWEALRAVPRGAVRTYAGLAADVGSPRATRAVGMAMATNPIAIVVPCHRVVGTRLALGGYSGGLDRKRLLLELEGVKVEAGHVLPGQLELLRAARAIERPNGRE